MARSSSEHVETGLLKRLLNEHPDRLAGLHDRYSVTAEELSCLLTELDKRGEVKTPDMAALEWKFLPDIDRLDEDRSHGIPNLERVVAESPMWFVRAVTLCYGRKDGGVDPPGWRVDDPEKAKIDAMRACHLLWSLRRIPGTDNAGMIHRERLQRWCEGVRGLCAEHDRTELGDQFLGQLLSNAPADTDGTWPCRPVCEVMESIGSLIYGSASRTASTTLAALLCVVWRRAGTKSASLPRRGGPEQRNCRTNTRVCPHGS